MDQMLELNLNYFFLYCTSLFNYFIPISNGRNMVDFKYAETTFAVRYVIYFDICLYGRILFQNREHIFFFNDLSPSILALLNFAACH